MRRLYVLYDPKCELCRRLKGWLQEQRQRIELKMLPGGSAEARCMFPGLEAIAGSNDLVVVSDEGQVYLNNRAWIMCLYALEQYSAWAHRLTHPLLFPLARQAFDRISKNRHAISRWLAMTNPESIASELRSAAPACCSLPETISDYLR